MSELVPLTFEKWVVERYGWQACEHQPKEGPRIPLRFGSSPSEVCVHCGAYRMMLHTVGQWQEGPPDLSEPEDH